METRRGDSPRPCLWGGIVDRLSQVRSPDALHRATGHLLRMWDEFRGGRRPCEQALRASLMARLILRNPSGIRQDQAPEVVGCAQAGGSGCRTKGAAPSWWLGEGGFAEGRDAERDDLSDCERRSRLLGPSFRSDRWSWCLGDSWRAGASHVLRASSLMLLPR